MYRPKMTTQTRMVLAAFLKDPDAEMYGREICAATGLVPGTVYPILARLERAGWLTSRWQPPQKGKLPGHPPRHYFRLTSDGWAAAREAARERSHS